MPRPPPPLERVSDERDTEPPDGRSRTIGALILTGPSELRWLRGDPQREESARDAPELFG